MTQPNNTSPPPCVVILAGDPNLDWWPISRIEQPVQFQTGPDGKSPFQRCLDAARTIAGTDRIIVAAPARCVATARQQVAVNIDDGPITMLVEPMHQGSLTPAALACQMLSRRHGDHLTLVLDASRPPRDVATFANLFGSLRADPLVQRSTTICATYDPTARAGSYYRGERMSERFLFELHTEPPEESAPIVEPSGLILLPSRALMKQVRERMPRLAAFLQSSAASWRGDQDLWPDLNLWSALPPADLLSFLTQSGETCLLRPVDQQAASFTPRDALAGQHIASTPGEMALSRTDHGQIIAVDTHSPLRILAAPDAILITDRDRPDLAERLVCKIAACSPSTLEQPSASRESWGQWQVIDAGRNHESRQLTLAPHGRMAAHLHTGRRERIVVLDGAIDLSRNGQALHLSQGDSAEIAVGDIHAIENPSARPAKLLELRFGSTLSDADTLTVDAEPRGKALEEA